MSMIGLRMRELRICSAPGARQTLLEVVHCGKAPEEDALVEGGGPHTPVRGSLVSLGKASIDRNPLVASKS